MKKKGQSEIIASDFGEVVKSGSPAEIQCCFWYEYSREPEVSHFLSELLPLLKKEQLEQEQQPQIEKITNQISKLQRELSERETTSPKIEKCLKQLSQMVSFSQCEREKLAEWRSEAPQWQLACLPLFARLEKFPKQPWNKLNKKEKLKILDDPRLCVIIRNQLKTVRETAPIRSNVPGGLLKGRSSYVTLLIQHSNKETMRKDLLEEFRKWWKANRETGVIKDLRGGENIKEQLGYLTVKRLLDKHRVKDCWEKLPAQYQPYSTTRETQVREVKGKAKSILRKLFPRPVNRILVSFKASRV